MIVIVINYIRQYPSLKQFIKFCLVGGTAALINFTVLYIFTNWLDVWYLISSVFGYIISAIFNFLANKLWTFKNKERGSAVFNQAVKFSFVILIGLIVNTAVIYLFTELFGFDYRFSWFVATGIIAVWNFGMNRLWTFRRKLDNLSTGDL